MRTAAVILLFLVAFTYAANGQKFTLLPQVGFENSKTSLSYNNLPYSSPLGCGNFSPQASLRLNYASRKGHGIFVGASSSRSTIAYGFSDPETGMTNFTANAGDMQVRLEGGYQFNSKRIYFNNKSKQSSSKSKSSSKTSGSSTSTTRSCYSFYSSARSRCGFYSSSCSSTRSRTSSCASSRTQTAQHTNSKGKGSWMSIQPSVGVGYIPWAQNDFVTKEQNGLTSYEYTAGNWTTAALAGLGFEFGKGNTRMFTVSLGYFKGLGNLGQQTFTTTTSGKTTTTTLDSKASGWNLRVGIPFTLGGTQTAKNKSSKAEAPKSGCQQYRYRCRTTL